MNDVVEVKNQEEMGVSYTEFSPILSEKFEVKLLILVNKLINVFPQKREEILLQEMQYERRNISFEEEKIETLKYIATICILKDLLMQGWEIHLINNKINLFHSFINDDKKESVRYRLEIEKRAQFESESNKQFIKRMEKDRKYNGQTVSIKNLIGDSSLILSRIQEIKKKNTIDFSKIEIIKPYLQLVDGSTDVYTGVKLSDIWRYFRYTWSIPYKITPGRNMFYLVRDESQPFHPVIGIFALGNTILNLTSRDNYIGWTVESIKNNLLRKVKVEQYEVKVKGQLDLRRKVESTTFLESEEKYQKRINEYCKETIIALRKFISVALSEIKKSDIVTSNEIRNPNDRVIDRLTRTGLELRQLQLDSKKSEREVNWGEESETILFRKKRTVEIGKLLEARMQFNKVKQMSYVQQLNTLLATEQGRKAIGIALVANRKRKIGSNIMEIIVCGAIPPYNELLAGKLISILSCSPTIIYDYENKYRNQVSEIASRMKGNRVVRDSKLAFLGTTSLYGIGSSQYNRIKIPVTDSFALEFKELGKTEGYGSVFFSKETTLTINEMLELIEGGRKINYVFGEGTSPRLRVLTKGLGMLGISSDKFLKHYTPRRVYVIELANNSKEFLAGREKHLNYYFNRKDNKDIKLKTDMLIEYWKKRWLYARVVNSEIDIENRLRNFKKDYVLISNWF